MEGMTFYLVDACLEDGEPYPLIAVPRSQYTVIRYLTVPIRNPDKTVENRFVAVIDIDPALNGHCYRFDDVVFPGNLMFRTTPGMLEYVARYPRIYDLMMVIAVSIFPDLEFNIVVEFAYQNERCLTKNHDQMVMYIWPSCDPDDTSLYGAMCDKIGEMNEYIEHNVFIPFEERYVLDGWLQVYYLCHP
jgi:hypothetical protein